LKNNIKKDLYKIS